MKWFLAHSAIQVWCSLNLYSAIRIQWHLHSSASWFPSWSVSKGPHCAKKKLDCLTLPVLPRSFRSQTSALIGHPSRSLLSLTLFSPRGSRPWKTIAKKCSRYKQSYTVSPPPQYHQSDKHPTALASRYGLNPYQSIELTASGSKIFVAGFRKASKYKSLTSSRLSALQKEISAWERRRIIYPLC